MSFLSTKRPCRVSRSQVGGPTSPSYEPVQRSRSCTASLARVHQRRPMPPPPQVPQGLMTPSCTWEGSNETNDKYKTWAANVYAWANQNGLSFLVKIARRIVDGMPASFSPPIHKISELEEFLRTRRRNKQTRSRRGREARAPHHDTLGVDQTR